MVDGTAELLGQEICGFESGISDMATRNGVARMVLQVLLTLLIQGTADNFLASCRHAAECSPAYTVNVVSITVGHWDGFIVAGLLFEIISTQTVAGEEGGEK